MLTGREKEVLELICKGYTNPEIAEELCVSVHTAKAHVNSIIRKFNASNRTLVTYIAAKKNLIDFDV